MLYVCRVTITGNLDVTWGYLWAAGFSAIPAVFLVTFVSEYDFNNKVELNSLIYNLVSYRGVDLGYTVPLNTYREAYLMSPVRQSYLIWSELERSNVLLFIVQGLIS